MCLALTLTISHAPRLRVLLYVREHSPIIISKLQLCGHDRLVLAAADYDAQTRTLNGGLIATRQLGPLARPSLLTIPARIAPSYLIEDTQRDAIITIIIIIVIIILLRTSDSFSPPSLRLIVRLNPPIYSSGHSHTHKRVIN